MNYKAHLDALKKRHKKLDMEIQRRGCAPGGDGTQLHLLKKQKLQVKEEIQRCSTPILGVPKLH